MSEIRYRKLLVELNENIKECKIVSADKDIKSITIPTKIKGMTVTEIDDNAFENCTELKSVKFPDVFNITNTCNFDESSNNSESDKSSENDKTNCDNCNKCEKNCGGDYDYYLSNDYLDFYSGFRIGSYAFQNCTSLKRIDIPDYVTMIDRGAFHNCTSLISVTLPDCFVAPYAFYHCSALKSITPISTISEGVFSHCLSLETLPITNKTTEFDEDAFEHCESLKNIVIPKSVKTIGSLAFRSCYGLKSVTFEDPESWYATNMYTDTEFSLNLSKPENNAKLLSSQDFDDGVTSWYKK